MAIALVLPESGCLVACERDAGSLEVAKKYYERAGVSHKVVCLYLCSNITMYFEICGVLQLVETSLYNFMFYVDNCVLVRV